MKPETDLTIFWCSAFVFCILAWVCIIYVVLFALEHFGG